MNGEVALKVTVVGLTENVGPEGPGGVEPDDPPGVLVLPPPPPPPPQDANMAAMPTVASVRDRECNDDMGETSMYSLLELRGVVFWFGRELFPDARPLSRLVDGNVK